MNEELTDDERSALQRMFWKNNEEIQRKLKEELTILSKYKGELAKNYEQVGAYQNTLVGFMKDILGKQDELLWVMRDLIKVITGKYPESKGRIEGIEVEDSYYDDQGRIIKND